MSIASELSALNGYILGAYDEINDKGGTVPANKNMANLASAIASISSGTPTTITPLNVTENGTYTAPTGTAYSPVTVNVSGGGGDPMVAGYHILSGTATVTASSNIMSVISYSDFMSAVGGSMPSKLALAVFDSEAAYNMPAGFAFKFGFQYTNVSIYYGTGSDVVRSYSSSSALMVDTSRGVWTNSSSTAKEQFKPNRTYGWIILWKN